MTDKTTARKVTRTARRVRGIVKELNLRAQQAGVNGNPVAYVMTGSQFDEILHAMGIVPVSTENYAGLCAAKRQAQGFLLRAEAEGYSNAICGYVRTGLGFDALRHELGHSPEGAPDGGMAQPDLMLGSSRACDVRFKWYQATGRYLDVPTYSIDIVSPPVDADTEAVADDYTAYQFEQLRGLVEFLEHQTKRKLNRDKLDAAFENSQQVFQVWHDCDQLRKAVPSPMPSEDHFNVFVPGNYYPCEPFSLDFFRALYDELTERVANGMGVIENERYRLLWAGGVPPWHSMWILNYVEEKGAVFVIERAYRGYDPVEIPHRIGDPLQKLAYRSFRRFTQKHAEARAGSGNPTVEYLKEYVRDYKVDGLVMNATKSCRATSMGQRYARHLIQQHVDIPFLQLESDMIDMRDYSEERWRSGIDAFMDVVASKK